MRAGFVKPKTRGQLKKKPGRIGKCFQKEQGRVREVRSDRKKEVWSESKQEHVGVNDACEKRVIDIGLVGCCCCGWPWTSPLLNYLCLFLVGSD